MDQILSMLAKPFIVLVTRVVGELDVTGEMSYRKKLRVRCDWNLNHKNKYNKLKQKKKGLHRSGMYSFMWIFLELKTST